MERYHILKLGLAILFYAAYCIRPMMVDALKTNDAIENNANKTNKLDVDDYFVYYQGVQGKPGVDFPVLSHIPRTAFSCRGIESGYYADLDTDCQVFHICEEGKKISFLCPNGTIFEQSELICEWWFKVNCTNSPNYYQESAEHLQEDNARRKANRRVNANIPRKNNHGAVMKTEQHASVSAYQNGRKYQVSSSHPSQVADKRMYENGNGKKINSHFSNNNREHVDYGDESLKHDLDINYKPETKRIKMPVDVELINPSNNHNFPANNKLDKIVEDSRFQQKPNGRGSAKFSTYSTVQPNFQQQYSSSKGNPNNEQHIGGNNEPTFNTEVKEQYKSGASSLNKENSHHLINDQPSVQKLDTVNNQESNYHQNKHELNNDGSNLAPQKGTYNQNIPKNSSNQQRYNISVLNSNATSNKNPFNNYNHRQYSPTTSRSEIIHQGEAIINQNLTSVVAPQPNRDIQLLSNLNTESNSPINSENGQNLKTGRPVVDGKGDTKQKSTVPLTRNDIVNRRLVESGELEETQIPQETASFYKNNFNSIQQNYKPSSPNPYPNHRQTYSDLTDPKYYNNKVPSTLSSVTPQYLTTQPINSGRPFVGIQVGHNLQTTTPKLTSNYNLEISTKSNYVVANQNLETSSTIKPIPSVNIDINSKSTPAIDQSTVVFKPKLLGISRNQGVPQTPKPAVSFRTVSRSSFGVEGTSGSKFQTVKPDPKIKNTQPKSGFTDFSNSRKVKPSQVSSITETTTVNTDYATSDIFNVGKTDKTNHYVSYSTPKPLTLTIPHLSVPEDGSLNVGRGSINVANYQSSTKSPLDVTTSRRIDHATVYGKFIKSSPSTSPALNNANSFRFSNENLNISTRFPKLDISPTILPVSSHSFPTPRSLNIHSNSFDAISSTQPTVSKLQDNSPSVNSIISTQSPPSKLDKNGFYVTKNFQYSTPQPTFSSTRNLIFENTKLGSEVLKPRPFQLAPAGNLLGATHKGVFETPKGPLFPTTPTYKISTAGPFSLPTTQQIVEKITLATTLATPRSSFVSPSEQVDNMINALVEMARNSDGEDYSGETPRPGLVVPPSAGPQTLHTLAVYFANALDEIAAGRDDIDSAPESSTKTNLDKEKLTELLTRMTMNRYKELFEHENKKTESQTESQTESATIVSRNKDDDDDDDNNDLEGQHSKSAVETPRVRQLARVFTQALSSYLDDPDTFKRVLQEVRPTEPPPLPTEIEETTESKANDEELLNFSDADAKSSYPPIFPTLPSVSPTWGYILALNTTKTKNNEFDIKNSLNPELENLQSADSQSFISQYNNLKNEEKLKADKAVESTTGGPNPLGLPDHHWTTSPGVTHLWKSTFSFDPAVINENIGTTETINSDFNTESDNIDETAKEISVEQPHHEINYELRVLPKLALNSTQVHGILINFMNKTDESSRLQRILRKLNTSEEEFLTKMKEIEANPLTRRLILLLISECGTNNATKDDELDAQAIPLHSLISRESKSDEILEPSSSISGLPARNDAVVKPEKSSSNFQELISPSLDENNQDTRALQLLNSLYTIASKFGK